MKAEEIAQWVINNRYPKSENNKVSDSEMYYALIEKINEALTIPVVVKSYPKCVQCGDEMTKNNTCYNQFCSA